MYYVALLRGINVGGNKKVPMADLKKLCEGLGYTNVITLLNTGNVIFESSKKAPALTKEIEEALNKTFGFDVPTQVHPATAFEKLTQKDPFAHVTATKDTKFYVAFLKSPSKKRLKNAPFDILAYGAQYVCFVLDHNIATPDAMASIETNYGKENVTTRNWNTVLKIDAKISA